MIYSPEEKPLVRNGVNSLLGVASTELPIAGTLFEVSEEIHDLLDRIAKDFGVAISQMQGRARGKKPISTARQFSMWAICNILGFTSDDAATALGRNRTTVIHAIKEIDKSIAADSNVSLYIDILIDHFGEDIGDGEDLI